MTPRRFHRTAALILLPFLLLSAVTGLTYRLGRNWFGMTKETGAVVRGIHEGRFLGEDLAPFYVLFVGLGLLGMVLSGVVMWRRSTAVGRVEVSRMRWLHRIASMIFFLPLAMSAVTGIGFRVTQSWLGWSEERAKILLDLHQGTWLGPNARLYYVLFVGLGLLFLLGSAVPMLRIRGKNA